MPDFEFDAKADAVLVAALSFLDFAGEPVALWWNVDGSDPFELEGSEAVETVTARVKEAKALAERVGRVRGDRTGSQSRRHRGLLAA